MELPAPVERALARVKAAATRAGIAVQDAVLTVLLALVYLVGFGLTRAYAAVFARRHLRLYDGPSGADSYWVEAQGYDAEGLERQF